jgi:hypothetical protein
MERFLNNMKQFRWVVTGGEQRSQTFLSFVHIMALRMMRPFVSRA